MKEWEKNQIPQKVQRMYDAVWTMLGEHQDLTEMTVSDITSRAGIGKGTAYEYFDSKEDLITGAMIYGVNREYGELRQGLLDADSFHDQMVVLFDWLEENYKMHRSFEQVLKVSIGAATVPKNICQQFRQRDCEGEAISIMDGMLVAAKEEGLLHQDNVFLSRITLASLLLQYIMYLLQVQEKDNGITDQEMRDRVYQELLTLL